MPIYEYRCQACGHVFEELTRLSAPAPACPKCQSADTARQLSSFAATGLTSAPCGADSPACGVGGDLSSGCGCCCGGGHHHH